MGFTKSTADIKVHQSMADYPRVEDGMSAEELKKKFDSPAVQLQEDLNNLIKELEDAGASEKIGANKLNENDTSSANIQAKLKKIYNEVQNVILGQIPDETITQSKIKSEYEKTLAKKDGTLQTNLNSEKLGGSTKQEIIDSVGVFNAIKNVSDTKNLTDDALTWETLIKGNVQEIELDNSRYFLIKVTLVDITTLDSDTTYTNLFLYDATLGIIIPFAGTKIQITGTDFSGSPNVYSIVQDTSGGVGFAFVSKDLQKISLQTAIYKRTTGGSIKDAITYNVRIDVTSFLTKI